MAKSNRATRKQLEEIIEDMIKELQFLRQGFSAIDNYLGAYVKFKGDTLTFNDFLHKEMEKIKKEAETIKTSKPSKDIKGEKKSRYNKVSIPPL
jgi:hypothetical protein